LNVDKVCRVPSGPIVADAEADGVTWFLMHPAEVPAVCVPMAAQAKGGCRTAGELDHVLEHGVPATTRLCCLACERFRRWCDQARHGREKRFGAWRLLHDHGVWVSLQYVALAAL